MGPGRQQDDRQVGLAAAQLPEQRDPFLAGRRVAREIHVLDHEVDAAVLEARERRLRAVHALDLDPVQIEEDLERGADRGVVVDDQDPGHGLFIHQTLRVAVAGSMPEARRAGP